MVNATLRDRVETEPPLPASSEVDHQNARATGKSTFANFAAAFMTIALTIVNLKTTLIKRIAPPDDLATLRLSASRFFASLLWLHVPVIALIAQSNGISISGVVAVMSLAAAAATLAAVLGGDKLWARLTIAAALTVAPALMVYAGQGPWQVDWHMYFFVVFGMLVAYVDWRPIAVAAAATMAHHALIDALFPSAVFPESGWGRVALHSGIVLVDIVVLFWIISKMRVLFERSNNALKEAGDALASANLLKSVVVNANDAVIISEIPLGADGRIDFSRRRVVYVNEALSTITGVPGAAVIGKPFDSLIPMLGDPAKFVALVEAAARHERAKFETIWRVPDGRELHVEGSFLGIYSVDGTFMNLVSVVRDVTERRLTADALLRTEFLENHNAALKNEIRERKMAEGRLTHAALHDELTGLPNRRLLRESLGSALARFRSGGYPAVLVCDIDRFQQVNGGLGQDVGDRLLIAIADRLGERLRDGDTLACFGGDKFSILVERTKNVEEVMAIANRVLSELAAPFQIDAREIYLTASIGVGLAESASESPDVVLQKAGLALQRAKLAGKACAELFTPDLLEATEHLLHLGNELRGALERAEMHAFYQPIVDLKSSAPVGFEALARWLRPGVGMIPPNDFIPLAEDTGIIVPLGRHILEEACSDLRCWIDAVPVARDLWVSVNVSPVQLREAGYAATVSEALVRNGLSGCQLHLEITETTVADLTLIGPILAGLRALGVHISIDDFGTGFSSLGYLDQLPIDSLKIDRSFVSGRGDGIANLKIIQTIVSLARELGLDVVAEGVETKAQADTLGFLTRWGQGYLFGRPMNADAALAYLQRSIETGAGDDGRIQEIRNLGNPVVCVRRARREVSLSKPG
jgi:diguanylate cyclase (GGDEF)-like protein/PAS domain S-box-containing protein